MGLPVEEHRHGGGVGGAPIFAVLCIDHGADDMADPLDGTVLVRFQNSIVM